MDDLTPIGEPPTRTARWCPRCQAWVEGHGRRRCATCAAALIRPRVRHAATRSTRDELRPGVYAEFDDPRDRYDPRAVLATLREKLR